MERKNGFFGREQGVYPEAPPHFSGFTDALTRIANRYGTINNADLSEHATFPSPSLSQRLSYELPKESARGGLVTVGFKPFLVEDRQQLVATAGQVFREVQDKPIYKHDYDIHIMMHLQDPDLFTSLSPATHLTEPSVVFQSPEGRFQSRIEQDRVSQKLLVFAEGAYRATLPQIAEQIHASSGIITLDYDEIQASQIDFLPHFNPEVNWMSGPRAWGGKDKLFRFEGPIDELPTIEEAIGHSLWEGDAPGRVVEVSREFPNRRFAKTKPLGVMQAITRIAQEVTEGLTEQTDNDVRLGIGLQDVIHLGDAVNDEGAVQAIYVKPKNGKRHANNLSVHSEVFSTKIDLADPTLHALQALASEHAGVLVH